MSDSPVARSYAARFTAASVWPACSASSCWVSRCTSSRLPRDAPAVRDMERLAARVVARDTALVLVIAPNAEARAAALDDAAARLATLDRGLVDRIERDDAETRAFLHARAHLLIPLPDLVAARDALSNRLREIRLAANPLYIELDDEPPTGADDVQLESSRTGRSPMSLCNPPTCVRRCSRTDCRHPWST